jgi:hypothetical protein
MVVKKNATPMRVSASGAVAQLREEVYAYHLEVKSALATITERCGHCRAQVDGIDLQVNGEKPERDGAPSMKSDIASLKQSRVSARRGLQFAWTALVGLTGVVVSLFTHLWK